jgi:arylsulfatase A-like enzyme
MSTEQPNLIYVFADQLRYQALSYVGEARAHTRNIDQFATQGVNFHQAIASAPVCTAYRASLLTGKYTTSHGMVINEPRMNPNQRCLGHVLTDAGYQTSYIGTGICTPTSRATMTIRATRSSHGVRTGSASTAPGWPITFITRTMVPTITPNRPKRSRMGPASTSGRPDRPRHRRHPPGSAVEPALCPVPFVVTAA